MTDRAIGVFDSGVGGLSVLRDIRHAFPGESTLYLGDNKRNPYGQQPAEKILHDTLQCLDFLYGQGVKALVIACSTATAVALEPARERYDVPVLGVIEPTATTATRVTSGRVGVMATQATVDSDAYARAIHAIRPDFSVSQQPCRLLIPLVESGEISGGNTESIVEGYLSTLRAEKVDTIVLGCTHFPFLRPIISRLAGEEIRIVESGPAVVESMARLMEEGKIAPSRSGTFRHKMFTTGRLESFLRVAGMLWHEQLPEVETVDLEVRR